MAGGAAHDPGRPILVFVLGNPDRTHAPGRVSPGAAPDGGPDRLRHSPARAFFGHAGPQHPEPPSCDAGRATPATAQGWRTLALAGGQHRPQTLRRGRSWSRFGSHREWKTSGGEWLVEKHGTKTRRSWRKLHVGLDAETGHVVAAALTAKDVDDGAEVDPLLDQVAATVASFTADSAYDQGGVSAAVARRHRAAAIIVPPRSAAVPSKTAETAPPLVFQPLRGRNLDQLRPRSGTAIFSSSPSTDVRLGRKRPATRSGLAPRQPLAGSSRSSVTGCTRARTGVGRPKWASPSMLSTVCWSWDARSPSASPEPQTGLGQLRPHP